MMFTTNGTPAEVVEFLDSPRGARTAHALSEAVFRDEDRLAAWELGELDLPKPVDQIIQAKVDARNARDCA